MGNITKKEVEKMQKRSQARKKRLEGRREHIRQTIESLLINDGFINDTKEIRNKWGIPKDGFCPNQVALDWQDKLRAKNPDFKFTEDFLAFHKQSIKTKLNLLGVNCESIVEQIMNLYIETGKLTPSKQYYYEVHKIKIKFGLDDRWMPFLTSLI
ncbi:MAG: hypothetical protein KJ811_02335, partial [Candidatus Margulisbacteria bacterium]|nr:hypothetical protein [Candidatus Margulisiibacteriota bacterium]